MQRDWRCAWVLYREWRRYDTEVTRRDEGRSEFWRLWRSRTLWTCAGQRIFPSRSARQPARCHCWSQRFWDTVGEKSFQPEIQMSGRLEKRAKPHSASRKSPDWTGIDWAGNAVLTSLSAEIVPPSHPSIHPNMLHSGF